MSMPMDIERFNFNKIFRDIERHVEIRLKAHQSKRTQTNARFYEAFETLNQLLGPLKEHQKAISEGCSKYDFVHSDGRVVKGNGYRSLLFLLSCLLQPVCDLVVKISKNVGNLTFSSVDAINNLCAYCRALQGMEVLFRNAAFLMQVTPAPQLFNNSPMKDQMLQALSHEYLCRDVFYGKLHGFQYAPTMKPLLYMINVAMASYEQWYNADRGDSMIRQLVSSLFSGGRYIQNSSRRGLKLDRLTTDTSVYFVKAFWSLLEGDALKKGMSVISHSVDVKTTLEIPAKTIKLEGTKGEEVELIPPSGTLGYKPIPLLLLSHKWREGQQTSRTVSSRNPRPLPPATGLIFHMHGGGYVAQSPHSHEFYLRKWTFELETPIVSVDYTLAPEGPFPRALDECVMAYAWVLQNTDKLGTTAERIIFVGDSAGGNFSITLAMKAKELGIRIPDAILSVYPSTNSTSAACASRVLAVVDPILPLGIMLACQQAYTGQLPDDDVLKMRGEYRQRIHKARGFYTPDPDARTPPPAARGNSSKASKQVPERPPPPSLNSLREVHKKSKGYSKIEDALEEVELNGDGGEQSDGAEALDKEDDPTMQSLLPNLPKPCVPEEEDKLSEQEIEELVTELMKVFESPEVTKDPYMSPMLATPEMLAGLPPIHLVGAALDPLLDDSVSMAQLLKSVNQPVSLDIVHGLPHGFLCMISLGNNSDLNYAHRLCLDILKKELVITPQK